MLVVYCHCWSRVNLKSHMHLYLFNASTDSSANTSTMLVTFICHLHHLSAFFFKKKMSVGDIFDSVRSKNYLKYFICQKVKGCKATEEVKPTKKNDLALGLSGKYTLFYMYILHIHEKYMII